MNRDHMPKPTDLMENPQLAILAALESALVAAMRALLAVHTDMLDDRFPRTVRKPDVLADRLIYLGGEVANALSSYRDAVRHEAVNGSEDF